MDVKLVRTVLRQFLPNLGLGPRAVALQLAWLVPLSLLLCYGAFMPVVALPDVTLHSYTMFYITASGLAMPTTLAIAASMWLMYAYWFSVTVSIVRPLNRGRTLAHHTIDVAGDSLLSLLIRFAHTWAILLGVIGRESHLYWTPSLLISPIRLGRPVHLATGWLAGVSPQLLYAPSASEGA